MVATKKCQLGLIVGHRRQITSMPDIFTQKISAAEIEAGFADVPSFCLIRLTMNSETPFSSYFLRTWVICAAGAWRIWLLVATSDGRPLIMRPFHYKTALHIAIHPSVRPGL